MTLPIIAAARDLIHPILGYFYETIWKQQKEKVVRPGFRIGIIDFFKRGGTRSGGLDRARTTEPRNRRMGQINRSEAIVPINS
jgi:hypothetical protein